ncbi:MAG: hypothetical protein ACLR17_04820 [Enterobacteriaceae bacterium]
MVGPQTAILLVGSLPAAMATQQRVSGFMGGKLVNSYFGELVGKGEMR